MVIGYRRKLFYSKYSILFSVSETLGVSFFKFLLLRTEVLYNCTLN
jgi:hypothetical protein